MTQGRGVFSSSSSIRFLRKVTHILEVCVFEMITLLVTVSHNIRSEYKIFVPVYIVNFVP